MYIFYISYYIIIIFILSHREQNLTTGTVVLANTSHKSAPSRRKRENNKIKTSASTGIWTTSVQDKRHKNYLSLIMTKLATTTDSIAELTTVIADNEFHGKRRMYACAALKLLATDPKMRSKLIRTQNVLSALLHVIYGKHSISQECTLASEALVSLLSDMQIYGTACNKNCAAPYDMPDAQELGSNLLTFVHKNRHIFRDYGLENDDTFYRENNANVKAERNSTLKSMKTCLDQISSSREAAVSCVARGGKHSLPYTSSFSSIFISAFTGRSIA